MSMKDIRVVNTNSLRGRVNRKVNGHNTQVARPDTTVIQQRGEHEIGARVISSEPNKMMIGSEWKCKKDKLDYPEFCTVIETNQRFVIFAVKAEVDSDLPANIYSFDSRLFVRLYEPLKEQSNARRSAKQIATESSETEGSKGDNEPKGS